MTSQLHWLWALRQTSCRVLERKMKVKNFIDCKFLEAKMICGIEFLGWVVKFGKA